MTEEEKLDAEYKKHVEELTELFVRGLKDKFPEGNTSSFNILEMLVAFTVHSLADLKCRLDHFEKILINHRENFERIDKVLHKALCDDKNCKLYESHH